MLRCQCIAHGPVRPDLSDFERCWSDFERNFDDFEQSLGIFRQISRDPLGVGWDAACWQAGERLTSLSIDNILLSEHLSKYWKNVCHPTDIPYSNHRFDAVKSQCGSFFVLDFALDTV